VNTHVASGGGGCGGVGGGGGGRTFACIENAACMCFCVEYGEFQQDSQ